MNVTRNDNKVALITGGATGIGACCSRAMAQRGYNIVINYFDYPEQAEKVVSECENLGVRAIAVYGDVSADQECRNVVARAVETFGGIDALICCAATTQFTQLTDLENQNSEDFLRIYGVNVIGIYQMARASAPYLKKSNNGAIVNFSSIASQNGSGSSLGYIASKGAVNSLSFALAKMLAPNVRVNCVLPGFVNTNWFLDYVGQERLDQIKGEFAQNSALRDICEPEEIAQAVVFLAIDATKTTGQLLLSDAGSTLGPSIEYSPTN
ncbi:MAG: SDR family NAD(P)-dependent oxidoreductase [Rhodobacteraceae bacterium]|nr:SDR family NAD(P)-dependent oxidoreductase [Paracoccaceae bacterium]